MSQFCEQKQLLVQDIRILKGLLLQKSVKLKYENDKMDNIRHFNTKKMFIKTNIQTGTKAPLSPKWPFSYCHKSKTYFVVVIKIFRHFIMSKAVAS